MRAAILKKSAAISIEDVVRNKKIKFIQDEVTAVDINDRRVCLKNRSISFEYLVFALGSESNFYNIPVEFHESLYTIKTFESAVRLRNSIKNLVERKNGTILICGGGASGVEIAGELAHCLKKDRQKGIEIILIEGKNQLLPDRDLEFARKAEERLTSLGVTVKTKTCIKAIKPNRVILEDGETVYGDIIIWTGGIKGNSALSQLELERDNSNRLRVNEYLETSLKNIFAIGDNASFQDKSRNKPLPGVAYIAIPEAKRAAENIIRDIESEKKIPFFYGKKKTILILPIGGKWAIADFISVKFVGFIAWFIKQLVELKYLLSVLPFAKALNLWLWGLGVYSKND
jgi:NADH dehydrogenase